MKKKKIDNEIFKTLIEDYEIKDTNDIKEMLKDLLSGTIQTMLEAEIEHELGYAKHSIKEKSTSNTRNGHSKKSVRSEYGNIELDIPRDRNCEFEPQIIPKYQREITGIEGQILSLFSYNTFIADSAFDSYEIFSILKKKFNFSRICIPINSRNTKYDKPNFNENGIPLCPISNEPFKY